MTGTIQVRKCLKPRIQSSTLVEEVLKTRVSYWKMTTQKIPVRPWLTALRKMRGRPKKPAVRVMETMTRYALNQLQQKQYLFILTGKMHFKSQCEKCKAAQQMSEYDKVTPRRISKGKFQVQLEGEGTYECSATGLVFEVSEQALVRYSVLSWSKFTTFLEDSRLKFAGPIFNVDVVNKNSSVLKSILFPHSLCVADPKCELKFSVLHIKNRRPLIEPSVDHSGSHVRWRVTSLSPVGPSVDECRAGWGYHGGRLLVYKARSHKNTFNFRVYLAANNLSEIKDITTQVRTAQRKYMKIDKSPVCNLDARKYQLLSEPDGEISPKELKFTFDPLQIKGYFEAYFEQPPPFTLSLKEANTDETVWCAIIREDGNDKKCSLSDKHLLLVAKKLGREWEQMAIYLNLTMTDLSSIKADTAEVTMQKLNMLVLWRNRRPVGEATAEHLLSSLKDLKELSSETEQLLNGLMNGSVK
ncbi:hypothetical protein CRUP_025076 [Coryphaenoides rupestris]|nr:hypothetical protein CRUP_025076 [Coryphaenoides rupestris]